ncbi:hypothetical protein BSLG_005864 [Batrachochytrium salamandrivorans]|nr:hypothetical protein BSLG_005864 [Batrachochytrium salamandrivorans]
MVWTLSHLNRFFQLQKSKNTHIYEEHKDRLTVPRRPKWTKSTTPDGLKLLERNSFLEWRRGLIVDGRNPLLFQCKDLEKYVKEVSPVKKNLLLISKADLLTANKEAWADYFDEQGISYKFFSAAMAKKKGVLEQEAEKLEREMAS